MVRQPDKKEKIDSYQPTLEIVMYFFHIIINKIIIIIVAIYVFFIFCFTCHPLLLLLLLTTAVDYCCRLLPTVGFKSLAAVNGQSHGERNFEFLLFSPPMKRNTSGLKLHVLLTTTTSSSIASITIIIIINYYYYYLF